MKRQRRIPQLEQRPILPSLPLSRSEFRERMAAIGISLEGRSDAYIDWLQRAGRLVVAHARHHRQQHPSPPLSSSAGGQ